MPNTIGDTKLNMLLKHNLRLETELSALSKEFIETELARPERGVEHQVAELLAQLMSNRCQLMTQVKKLNISIQDMTLLYNELIGTDKAPVFFLGSVEQDAEYALINLNYSKWYHRTGTGSLVSLFNMGMLYLLGLGGIQPNLADAYTWLSRADRQMYCCTEPELRIRKLTLFQLEHFEFSGTTCRDNALVHEQQTRLSSG